MLLFRIIYCHFERRKFWLRMFLFLIFQRSCCHKPPHEIYLFIHSQTWKTYLVFCMRRKPWIVGIYHYTSQYSLENQLKIYDLTFIKPCQEYRFIIKTILKLFPQYNLNCSSALRLRYYPSQYGLTETWLLLIENFSQYPALRLVIHPE